MPLGRFRASSPGTWSASSAGRMKPWMGAVRLIQAEAAARSSETWPGGQPGQHGPVAQPDPALSVRHGADVVGVEIQEHEQRVVPVLHGLAAFHREDIGDGHLEPAGVRETAELNEEPQGRRGQPGTGQVDGEPARVLTEIQLHPGQEQVQGPPRQGVALQQDPQARLLQGPIGPEGDRRGRRGGRAAHPVLGLGPPGFAAQQGQAEQQGADGGHRNSRRQGHVR